MAETAARAGEIVGMAVPDLDLPMGMAVIRRGKGGKGRRVPFGPQTARAIDRYLRMRRRHRLADTQAQWLGDRGKSFGYPGLYQTLMSRAEAAGIEDFHPYVLRHTGATR
ncbi:tyrosine-type recombinase/integrase [Nonomuraea typhae]|uniref:tyrosine-type recombinase/integrase n=1 Tax=Nonomuraea typhae TaxID=2603600 RepID=UPI001CA554CE|nr:tyrosine-type recombinase/integrase [Nonomuraea typhae]